MNTFTMKDILEILQAAQLVLLIVKQLLGGTISDGGWSKENDRGQVVTGPYKI